MSYTKATLGDIEAAETTATATGAAASDSAETAAGVSQDMESGIEEVGSALLTHFNGLATTMQGQASQAMRKLGGTDWEGKSREMAVDAETSLRTRLEAVLASAEQGTQQFTASLTADAQAFVGGVRGQFATVMASVDVAFKDLAAAEQAFAQNLREADETIQAG